MRLRRLAVLPLIALSLTACGARPKPTPSAPLAVEAVSVAAPADNQTIVAGGVLRRERESALAFRLGGVVTRLGVDAGDAVVRGQVLAILDDTTAGARLRQSAADLERVRRDVARYEGLAASGMISRKQMDDQRTALLQAQAAYDSAAFDSRGTQLVSPASGVVLSRSAQVGEVVQPGQTILTIADAASGLVLRVPVADRDLPKVRLGAAAEVRLAALPNQSLAGRVTRIGQEADARSGAVMTEISVPAQSGLRSGMLGEARLVGAGAPSGRASLARVPAETVIEANGGRAFVYRVDSRGIARRTQVTFEGFDGDDALVSGLPPGDRLITAGAGYVRDGEAVKVVEFNPPASRLRGQP
jgi:RND family efflux transporter MFP subunit